MTSRPTDPLGVASPATSCGGSPPDQAATRGVDLTRRRSFVEVAIERVFKLCACLSIFTASGIVLVLFGESIAFFQHVSLGDFFGDTPWAPLAVIPHFGIWPLLCGTFLTTLGALVVAAPLGVLAAIYLSEYAPPRLRAWLKPMLAVLASVPTVVYGYFALTLITPTLQGFIPGLAGTNALAAGLVMGLMILPIIASISEDAIHAVPTTLRESAAALGGTRVRTLWRVVLPSARSGIGAAIILGVSRAIGETMIVAVAAGLEPRLTLDPRQPVETMSASIVQVSGGAPAAGSLAVQAVFAVGLALFLMTLGFNALSHRLRRRIHEGRG